MFIISHFLLALVAEIRNKYDQKTGRKVSAQRGKRLGKRALNAELKRRRNAPFNAGLGKNDTGSWWGGGGGALGTGLVWGGIVYVVLGLGYGCVRSCQH